MSNGIDQKLIDDIQYKLEMEYYVGSTDDIKELLDCHIRLIKDYATVLKRQNPAVNKADQ